MYCLKIYSFLDARSHYTHIEIYADDELDDGHKINISRTVVIENLFPIHENLDM